MARSRIESVESRRLLSRAPLVVGDDGGGIIIPTGPDVEEIGGILTVRGTSGADLVRIGPVINGPYYIEVNGDGVPWDVSSVTRIEVQLSDGADRLEAAGVSFPMYVSGGSGDDTIFTGSGNDTLTGGGGRNRLYAGDGDDRLNGSGGRDFLYGQAGTDRLYGNGGNDYLDGGGGTDRLFGGDGDDQLFGGSSIDRLYGDAGNDTLVGGAAKDYLFGGDGTDSDGAPDPLDLLDSIEA